MFGNSFKNGKGLGNVMKMMMFSQMMGVNQGNINGIGQMMAMSMFMGGKENPFEGMFDVNLDLDEEETEEETKTEE
jgi:TRAP-type C4-dicarboxylate transport system permease large subunit